MDVVGKSIADQRNSQCKASEAGASLVSLRISRPEQESRGSEGGSWERSGSSGRTQVSWSLADPLTPPPSKGDGNSSQGFESKSKRAE